MALSPEKIAELLAGKKSQPAATATKPRRQKFIRRQIHWPAFPKDGPVTWHDTYPPYPKLHCASRGCRRDTPFKLRGIPYCIDHLCYLMAMELTDVSRRIYGNGSTKLNGTGSNISPEGSLTNEGTL